MSAVVVAVVAVVVVMVVGIGKGFVLELIARFVAEEAGFVEEATEEVEETVEEAEETVEEAEEAATGGSGVSVIEATVIGTGASLVVLLPEFLLL